MLIEEALYQLLKNDAGVNAIVEGRVYPVTIPQLEKDKTSYPAVVFDLASRERHQTHDGPTLLVKSQYTLDVLGPRYFEVKTLADKVRLAVNGKRADLQTLYGNLVKGVFLDNEQDDYVFDEVEQLSLYRVPMDVTILHWDPVT